MLYVDLPSRDEFAAINAARADTCVTIYLRTTPVTRETEASRIEFRNLLREAQNQLEEAGFDKRRMATLMESLRDLLDDEQFWRFQANSLAVFATPDSLRTFRLANELTSMVQVADRFHLKPLFRAVTFGHSAYVLALSENAARLVEIHGDMPAAEVKVPGMPVSAADFVDKSTLNDRTFSGRIHGSEGQNVRFQQYARQVDAVLRPLLYGREIPLILAATGRLADVFRQVNSYPHLLAEGIVDSPDRLSEAELAGLARPILTRAHAESLAGLRALYQEREGQHRATSDISSAAHAATFGAIDTLLVNIDSVVPGFVDDATGKVEFVEVDDAVAYGVVDEIAARAFASGATVLGVRREDLPAGDEVAAILRYAL